MTEIIDIKVKDQFSNIYNAKAILRVSSDGNAPIDSLSLFHRIEHIVVNDEIILPSIELLFESKKTDSIYRLIDQNT